MTSNIKMLSKNVLEVIAYAGLMGYDFYGG
jgi:GH18 family chitinase